MPSPEAEAFDIQMVPGAGHLTLTEISISFLIVCKLSHGFQRLSLQTQKNKFGKIIYYVAVLLKKNAQFPNYPAQFDAFRVARSGEI